MRDILSGYNATVFAYGQSGSGKTYTMEGTFFFFLLFLFFFIIIIIINNVIIFLIFFFCKGAKGFSSDPSQVGIIPRAAAAIFDGVLSADENIEFMLCASFVEIYMERIRDLLDDVGVNTNLQIREDPVKGIYIEGVTEEYITSPEEMLDLMAKGNVVMVDLYKLAASLFYRIF